MEEVLACVMLYLLQVKSRVVRKSKRADRDCFAWLHRAWNFNGKRAHLTETKVLVVVSVVHVVPLKYLVIFTALFTHRFSRHVTPLPRSARRVSFLLPFLSLPKAVFQYY